MTWGTWENKGPPHHVMLSFCCFCTRVFRAPPIRLGDGSPLPLQYHPPVTGVLKWEILESALGSAPEGAPGNRGAPESAQGN